MQPKKNRTSLELLFVAALVAMPQVACTPPAGLNGATTPVTSAFTPGAANPPGAAPAPAPAPAPGPAGADPADPSNLGAIRPRPRPDNLTPGDAAAAPTGEDPAVVRRRSELSTQLEELANDLNMKQAELNPLLPNNQNPVPLGLPCNAPSSTECGRARERIRVLQGEINALRAQMAPIQQELSTLRPN